MYGTARTTVKSHDNGRTYIVESEQLLAFLGQNQEIKSQQEFRVGPGLEPVYLQSVVQQSSGSVVTEGRVADGALVMSRKFDGLTRTARIDLSEEVIFRPCIPDWLVQQPDETMQASVRVLDIESLTAETAVFRRLESGGPDSVWGVSLRSGPVDARGRIELREGVVLRESFEVPRSELIRVEAGKSLELRRRNISGREVLAFPVKQHIARPEHLRSMTVRLSWKGIPLNNFDLSDSRQAVVSSSLTSGRHEVVVRINPAPGDEAFARLPVAYEKYRPYLTDTPYIRPSDARIAALARKTIGDVDDARAAGNRISQVVFELLDGGGPDSRDPLRP